MKNNSVLHLKAFSLILICLLAFVFSTHAQQASNQQAATETKQEIKSDIKTAEKTDANVPANPANNQTSKVARKTVNNGLFSYEVTGNEQMDNDLYSAAKQEFINQHPDLYEKWVRGEISTTTPKTLGTK